MVKIAVDAGHSLHTAGKRTPDGEREWSFNNKVLLAAVAKLNTYQNVQILRLDDPTGKIDIPLRTRTDKANRWGADVLVSIHHNAHAGRWGSHGGVETYRQPGSSTASVNIARLVHSRIVRAMGLRDRGVKTKNLHMTRESIMPAILTEGGFMDSTTDIEALRSDAKLKAQGVAIAEGLAAYFKLKSGGVVQVSKPAGVYDLRYGDTGARVSALQSDLNKFGARIAVDGSFGRGTENAVKAFQRKYSLTADGIFGPASQRKVADLLKPLPAPKPIPKPKPKPKADIYRVIIDGKQVGAYSVDDNALKEAQKAMAAGNKSIKIEKV